MSYRGDTGYPDDEDESWRAKAKTNDTHRTHATQAARDLGPIMSRVEALEALGLPVTATAPSGLPVCATCGKESKAPQSIAGDVVVLDGIRLVGCVRRHCGFCAGKAARESMVRVVQPCQ